ncbi:MAG: hypothetical protein AAB227_05810 [Pseudomonadota bacterium]
MMDDREMRRLKAITQDLAEFDDSLTRNGKTEHLIESRTGDDGAFEIYANAEGLVHMARQIMQLAQARIDGKHLHFDAAGMLEKSDHPFLVSYKSAEWDKRGGTDSTAR